MGHLCDRFAATDLHQEDTDVVVNKAHKTVTYTEVLHSELLTK